MCDQTIIISSDLLICPFCHLAAIRVRCEVCEGKKKLYIEPDFVYNPCPSCEGTGYQDQCPACGRLIYPGVTQLDYLTDKQMFTQGYIDHLRKEREQP